ALRRCAATDTEARQAAGTRDDDVRLGGLDTFQRRHDRQVLAEALMDEGVEALVTEGLPPGVERHVLGACGLAFGELGRKRGLRLLVVRANDAAGQEKHAQRKKRSGEIHGSILSAVWRT